MAYETKILTPLCPYCYDGEITMDEFGTISCNACKRNVTIRKSGV